MKKRFLKNFFLSLPFVKTKEHPKQILKKEYMAKKDNELEFAAGASNSEKLKALQAAMDKIEKSFGKGSIMKLGDEKIQDVEVIPTGSVALN